MARISVPTPCIWKVLSSVDRMLKNLDQMKDLVAALRKIDTRGSRPRRLRRKDDPVTDRQATLDLLRRLSASSLGKRLVLCGSSGIHAVSSEIPAMTEDVDLLIDAEWLGANQRKVLAELEKVGFEHQAGTCTLAAPAGESLDLVGYSEQDRADRVGGGEAVPVMVFGDLSVLLGFPGTVVEVPSGGRALSAAALTTSKLLTIRSQKGNKDKLQALLLIEENADDDDFLAQVRQLFGLFDRDRVQDAVADAQMALLTLSAEGQWAESEVSGYAGMAAAASRGFTVLENLVGEMEGGA